MRWPRCAPKLHRVNTTGGRSFSCDASWEGWQRKEKKGGGCAGHNADVPNLERFTSSCHPPDHALTGETLCVSIAFSDEVEDEARDGSTEGMGETLSVSIAFSDEVEDEARDGSTEAWIEAKRREEKGRKGQ